MLPDSNPPSQNYADRLVAKVRGLNDDGIEWIVTRDPVEGLPCPGVVVADQWARSPTWVHSSQVEDLPPPDELIEWVRYLQVPMSGMRGRGEVRLRSWTRKEDVVRVLLAIDGSAHSDAAVTEVAARPWPKGTSVRVLTVVHAAAPLIPDPAFVIAAIHVEQAKEQSRHAPKIVAAAR